MPFYFNKIWEMLVRKLCGRNILHIIYVWYEIWCRATQVGDLTRNVISWISWFGKCLSITSNLLCLSSLDMVGFEVYDIHCNVDKPSGLLAFFIFFIWVFIKKNCYYSCNGMNDSFYRLYLDFKSVFLVFFFLTFTSVGGQINVLDKF